MHKVVNRLVQALRKYLRDAADRVLVHEIIFGKPAYRTIKYPALVFLRIFSYIAVNGGGEQMPKSRVYKPLLKELPYDLQGIDGFLFGLRREAIHQIGMHQDTRFVEIIARVNGLTDGHSFIH